MEDALQDLLFQLGYTEKGLVNNYIEKVANKGLTSYKRIIQDRKERRGEPLHARAQRHLCV